MKTFELETRITRGTRVCRLVVAEILACSFSYSDIGVEFNQTVMAVAFNQTGKGTRGSVDVAGPQLAKER